MLHTPPKPATLPKARRVSKHSDDRNRRGVANGKPTNSSSQFDTEININLRGGWGTITGVTEDYLHQHLSVLHPKRFFSAAFRSRAWDGKVKFHEGNRFPAGLLDVLCGALHGDAKSFHIRGGVDPEALVNEDVPADYLRLKNGSKLRDYQLEAIHRCISARGGVVSSPTSSGKTAMIAALAKYFLIEYGMRTLVVVPKIGIMYQTVEEFNNYFAGDDIDVGMVGDQERIPGKIVVGTAQTLSRFRDQYQRRRVVDADPFVASVVSATDVIMLDECHHTSSTTWYDLSMKCPASRRYGFSGTPIQGVKLNDRKLVAATGPVLYTIEPQAVIEGGHAAKPIIAVVSSDRVSGPAIESDVMDFVSVSALQRWDNLTEDQKERALHRARGRRHNAVYEKAYVNNKQHNRAVIAAASWLVDRGKRTLILCRRLAHYKNLEALLRKSGISYYGVEGLTEQLDRKRAKDALNASRVQAVLATEIWSEGENIVGVDAVVLAEGVKAITNTLQRIGRGMRIKQHGENEVWVVDFAPRSSLKLYEHAIRRVELYEGAGYEVCLVDQWPKDHKGLCSDTLFPCFKRPEKKGG